MTSHCFKESTFRKEIIDRAVDCSVAEDTRKQIDNTYNHYY